MSGCFFKHGVRLHCRTHMMEVLKCLQLIGQLYVH